MAQIIDSIFVSAELVLIAFFFIACLCSACLRRRGGGAPANGGQQQGHPRAPSPVAATPPRPPPPRPDRYAARSEEQMRAPVVLPHFPYPARARVASEPPPACAICLDELRQGQLCSEVPACRHVFHEGCIRAWAKKKNTCPLCRARVVLPRAAYGVAAADDMV